MLTAAKAPKKKIIIYVVIILIMLAGNIFIYYSNTQQDDLDLSHEDFIPALDQQLTDFSYQQTTLSQSILEHNVFLALKKVGDWPIIPTDMGKADPFAPFISQTTN